MTSLCIPNPTGPPPLIYFLPWILNPSLGDIGAEISILRVGGAELVVVELLKAALMGVNISLLLLPEYVDAAEPFSISTGGRGVPYRRIFRIFPGSELRKK
jgi:hypothetical protein